MDIQKTMEFILEQQGHCAALYAQREARHAQHETRDAEHEARRAEHDADIKEIRRLLLKSSAMRVQDRHEFRNLHKAAAKEMKELKQEVKALTADVRETERVLQDFIRSMRGQSGNGSSHKK